MRRFADLDLEIDATAEETSLLNFRHLLEKNPLGGQKRHNQTMSSISSRAAPVSPVTKCRFGYRRVRYPGPEKNAAKAKE